MRVHVYVRESTLGTCTCVHLTHVSRQEPPAIAHYNHGEPLETPQNSVITANTAHSKDNPSQVMYTCTIPDQ